MADLDGTSGRVVGDVVVRVGGTGVDAVGGVGLHVPDGAGCGETVAGVWVC